MLLVEVGLRALTINFGEGAGIELPDGRMTHVLRHTLASHFVMKGGSVLTLQRVPGHRGLETTMRDADFSPDPLLEAFG